MKEFNKIIGYKSIKTELKRIADMMKNPERYSKLGVTTTKGLLLYGEPGVGKTLMAKCLIKASKRKSFTIRKDIPNGDFVKHIKDTFEKAKKATPSIVFLDDMDKFANEDSKHQNAEEFVTIQSCIDDVKESEVFILATANDLINLPKSLLRPGRFDKTIKVQNPKGDDVSLIVKHYLKNKKLSDDVDYKEIARLLDGRSCAALETIINEAGVYAAYENRASINMNDIIRSFMRTDFNAPEVENDNSGKYLKNNAVHEAGHILVSEIQEPDSVTFATIKKHSGDVEGFVSFKNDDDYFQSITYMENRVRACLAGKAATEVVLGIVDVGATVDLDRAFTIAERIVNNYCSFGFSYTDRYLSSDESLLSRKNNLIQTEMERYYQQTKRILIENREFLDKLTSVLVDRKVLVHNDIQKIKAECTIKSAFC